MAIQEGQVNNKSVEYLVAAIHNFHMTNQYLASSVVFSKF
jgi:hypothetical protein